ncbi:ABC transporter family substrate-binding protein [Streptacidiphilus carbonis]|uniref:ABC transporter family substrate-binding protein n=1 Tax=Streptacidiphilus carbonis TaxID=105422 RepID=UPI000A629006|nr:ABC transporter family substrate-binding protein [Streptacidiphilus carbonis]
MKHNRIPVALVATMAVASLGLSACSSGSKTGSTAKPSASSLAASTIKINAQPRSALKQGGTLTWAIDQYSTQWNYNQINGTEYSTDAVIEAVEPIIFRVDPATQKVTPNTNYLAGMPTVTTVNGKQTVTYNINPKAKWSDGTAISWKDFAAQWQALNGKDTKYQIASSTGYSNISSIVAGATPQQVVVTFDKNFGDWTSLFSPLYPASAQSTPAEFNSGFLNKIPVTAGPFKIESMNATAQTVTVARDPNWWGDAAVLDKIVFRAMTTDAADGAYANGEVDYLNIGPSAAGVKQAQGRADGEIREAAGPQFRHVTFNSKSPMLSDVKVRQALFQAIDRTAIANSDLKGLGWPALLLNNHFFMNNQEGYQDNAGDLGKYDPTAAKAALDAAGWKMSGQYRQKDGKNLELTFVYPDGTAVSKNESVLLQAMFAAVGVKLDISAVPSDDFFDKYVQPGKFDLTAFSWLGNAWPVSSNYSIYQSPQGSNNFQNYAWTTDPSVDSLMNKSIADLDHTQAIADANAADKAIWQDAGVFPLYQRADIYAAKKTLANLGAPQDQNEVVYENIGFTG